MRRVLYRGFQTIELLRWYETDTPDTLTEFRDMSAALDFLRPWVHDPFNMLCLRAVLAEEMGSTGIAGLHDQEVLDQLAWCIVNGQVKIVLRSARRQASVALPNGITEQAEEAERAPTTPPTDPSWIKFKVVEDETGQPVQGVKLKVKLPTGPVKEYTTDAHGMVEIEPLPSGTCDIEKMLDSDALEVVDVG